MPESDAVAFAALTLDDLCDRCRRETGRFRRDEAFDAGPCLEIFTRAICNGDGGCWEQLHQIYGDQVQRWCRRACQNPAADHAELVAIAWEHFWRSFTAERLALASGLGAVLTYLRMCVWSAAADDARGIERAASLDRVLGSDDNGGGTLGDILPSDAPTPADEVAADAGAAELWQLVASHAHDDRELAILHLTLEIGLKSREIFSLHPELFESVQEVYVVTRNVLDRVRRNPALRRWREDRS